MLKITFLTDTNECASDNLHNCDPALFEVCLNTVGSYKCVCPVGYKRLQNQTCIGKLADIICTVDAAHTPV